MKLEATPKMNLTRAASAEDYREIARRRIPKLLFDYVEKGSYDEQTLSRNVTDLAGVCLRQRVMRDVSSLNTEVHLLDHRLSMPVMLGPIGFAGMLARRGEVQAARAACGADVPFILSTVGICTAREVAAGCGRPPWFQLYMIRDRAFMRELLHRVQAIGCPALVVTVDLAVPGTRYADIRSGMASSVGTAIHIRRALDAIRRPRWLRRVYFGGRPHTFGNLEGAVTGAHGVPAMWEWIRRNFDPAVTWADLEFLREHWSGTILIKGVLNVEDAKAAAAAGADAVIVSNHGGRQLDSAPSTISVLPRIVEAVGERLPVLMDGGIRSGLDVLKALSLGARACLLGRAWAYALAAGGEKGVEQLLGGIREELRTAMALTGCSDVEHARIAHFSS